MTIIYRTNGPWGTGQGSNLSAAEVDGNFFDLDQQIASLTADHHNLNRSIDHITVDSNNNMFVFYTDGTSDGPFKLPIASWNFTGPWRPTTPYVGQRDIFTFGGGIYLVLLDHNSATTFDPGATNGSGRDLYQLLIQIPAIQSITLTDTNFTPTLAHINSYLRFVPPHDINHAHEPVIFTVPPAAQVNFAAVDSAAEFHVRDQTNIASAGVQIVAGSGVIIHVADPFALFSAFNGASMFLKLVGPDEWDLGGQLLIH